MCVCAWYKMAGTPSEFPPGVLEQAIDYVAGEVSKDVQMRRLVSKYHASINVEFSDYAAATKSLMQDGALTNLFRAAVQKRAWFLKKQLEASNIESSQEEAPSEQTSTGEEPEYRDDILSSHSSDSSTFEHDLEETHYEDDWANCSFGSGNSSGRRKVSFNDSIAVKVIPRTSEESIDELFYSEREIDKMFEESEAERGSGGD